MTDLFDPRTVGRSVRDSLSALLASESGALSIRGALGYLGYSFIGRLSDELSLKVANDLLIDPGWAYEYWTLDEAKVASTVSEEVFNQTQPNRRFSRNSCLRHPSMTALALRGLLSALTAPSTLEMVSEAAGMKLKFVSADVARYDEGDYLRFHADQFERRRLAVIYMATSQPHRSAGGELIVSRSSGAVTAVPPLAGSLIALALRPDLLHAVAEVSTSTWSRLSIAAHYALVSRDL